MGTTVSLSSPEPEERNVVERAWHILSQKPLRMGSMLRLSRLMNDATPNEKLILFNSGVVQRIVDMIDERSHVTPAASSTAIGGNIATTAAAAIGNSKSSATGSPAAKRNAATNSANANAANNANNNLQASAAASASSATSSSGGKSSKAPRNNFVTQITTNSRRKSNAYNLSHRGIGYGFGSTRSHWDIERTIEEQMAREEQMVWLMNALTAYVFCANPDFQDLDDVRQQATDRDRQHITNEFVSIVHSSTIPAMLEYHLKNESLFDISEHMEFYQALLELMSCMCLYTSLAELLVYPLQQPTTTSTTTSNSTSTSTSNGQQAQSICLHLLPRFRDQLLTYLTSPTVRMGSPDFRLIDFIQRVQKWCDVGLTSGRTIMNSSSRQQQTRQSTAKLSTTTMATGSATAGGTTRGSGMRHYDSIEEVQQAVVVGGTTTPLTSPNAEYLMAKSEIGAAMSTSSSGLTVSSSGSLSQNANDLLVVGSASSMASGGSMGMSTATTTTTAAISPTSMPGLVETQISAPSGVPEAAGATAAAAGGASESKDEDAVDVNSTKQALEYRNALKTLQINTWKFIGDFGKLVVPFTYRKEAKSLNPFSPSLKERTKRIARELASLHNALPLNWSNSIFIAVDEGRCDIMKVLITGPEETPYQNGCFEFDLFFPSGYPFSPPKVSFLTTGNGEVRFNPNLYQDGKVCLSILNTWEGRPEEKWNPYCSMLQVLVSIQALIFVKEPYFNEPGFERYIGTEKGQHLSNAYNQQLQHATLHYAVLEQLKQPPEYFKDVIRRHFWLKKESIREQAHQWLRVAQADAAAYAKEKDNSKKGGSGSSNSAVAAAAAAALDSGLGVVSVRGMERTVELLDQELAQLSSSQD